MSLPDGVFCLEKSECVLTGQCTSLIQHCNLLKRLTNLKKTPQNGTPWIITPFDGMRSPRIGTSGTQQILRRVSPVYRFLSGIQYRLREKTLYATPGDQIPSTMAEAYQQHCRTQRLNEIPTVLWLTLSSSSVEEPAP